MDLTEDIDIILDATDVIDKCTQNAETRMRIINEVLKIYTAASNLRDKQKTLNNLKLK